MKHKYCILASLAVFITFCVVEFLAHGLGLANMYQQTADVWRPHGEMKTVFWLMYVGYLIFSPFFVAIYSKGYEEGKSGLGQGLRFGALVGLMLAPMTGLVWYVVLPIPKELALAWIGVGFLEYLILGLVVGLVWKKEA